MKVAVVEDDVQAYEYLVHAVEANGYEVIGILVEEDTLEDVVRRLEGVDVVLLDHFMYKFNGEDVAERLPKSVVVVSTSSINVQYAKTKIYGKDRNPEGLCRQVRKIISELELQ